MRDLHEGARALLTENAAACNEAARSTLSTTVLSQRLVIIERYLIALARQTSSGKEKSTPKYKSKVTEANLIAQKR